MPLVDGQRDTRFNLIVSSQFDAVGDSQFIDSAKKQIIDKMATHVSHTGVHDHGFNNLSTYGNLLRLMHEGKIEFNEWEAHYYELAIKISGAVQAYVGPVCPRWFHIFIQWPHSLFVDTIRSCRILRSVICWACCHGEGDKNIIIGSRYTTYSGNCKIFGLLWIG